MSRLRITASLSLGRFHGFPAVASSLFPSTRSLSTTPNHVSERGQQVAGFIPNYLKDARDIETYSAADSPDGALQLGVAESLMLEDWLLPVFNRQELHTFQSDQIYYQATLGRQDFRHTFAGYIEIMLNLPRGRINADQGLVLGAGCNAVLENLCFTLADQGDSVLIPRPYYAAFEFDLAARAGLRIEAVGTNPSISSLTEPEKFYPTTETLDEAFSRAIERGSTPRILILSHPNNPLGIVFPPEIIENCINWCRDRKVHLVSDEIYAGSVYKGEFRSAIELAGDRLGPYIHWVYALSKDLAVSGLRVGAAYTENESIQFPLQKLNDLCQVQ